MRSRTTLLTLALIDLVAVAIATGLHAPAAVRTPLALPLVLFLPGWALTRDVGRGMDGYERAAAAIGLSLALAAVGALLLNLLPWGVRPLPWAVLLGAVTVAALAISYWRERSSETPPAYALARPRLGALSLYGVAGAIVVLAVVVAREGALRQSTPGFTQFWMQQGASANSVAIGVTNHEHDTIAYRVRLTAGDRTVGAAGPFTVNDGATLTESVAVTDETPGQPITATLYRVDQPTAAYRQATLWPQADQAVTRAAP